MGAGVLQGHCETHKRVYFAGGSSDRGVVGNSAAMTIFIHSEIPI